jgi:hypothetical protein
MKAFRTACQLLVSAGLELEQSHYHPDCFGSWFASVCTNPLRRIVWDGRDFELCIHELTDQTHEGTPIWKIIWEARKCEGREDQVLKQAVDKVCEIAGTRRADS